MIKKYVILFIFCCSISHFASHFGMQSSPRKIVDAHGRVYELRETDTQGSVELSKPGSQEFFMAEFYKQGSAHHQDETPEVFTDIKTGEPIKLVMN